MNANLKNTKPIRKPQGGKLAKVKRDPGFQVLPHKLIRNSELSTDARFLFAYLNSHSDRWKIRQDHLRSEFDWGKVRLSNAIEDLEKFRHLERAPRKTETGQIIPGPWDWVLDEDPRPPSDGVSTDGVSTSGGSLEDQSLEDQLKDPPNPQGDEGLFDSLPRKDPSEFVDKCFGETWDYLRSRLPPARMARHSKKRAKAQFDKAVKDRSHSAEEVRDAIMFMLGQRDFAKEDYQFLPALDRLIRDEKYVPFMGRDVDKRSAAEKRRDEKWQGTYEIYALSPNRQFDPSMVPEDQRKWWPPADWKKFGWL